jgi:hypothetical protein
VPVAWKGASFAGVASICEGPFVNASGLGIGAKRGARFANKKA